MACLLNLFKCKDKKEDKNRVDFKALQERRFSCRKFNSEKIDDKTINEILFDASLTPSSFGIEPWQFYVLSKDEDKERFALICMNQPQVKNCSHVVIIAARIDLKSDGKFLNDIIGRKQSDPEKFKTVLEKFGRTFDSMSEDELYAYSSNQCYLACANLVNSAISKDVDSCIIGGFNKKQADEFLEIGQDIKSVVVVSLGKKDCEITPKLRRDLKDVAIFK